MKATTRRQALLAALAAPVAAVAPAQAATKTDEFDSLMDQYANSLFSNGIMLEVRGKVLHWIEITTGDAAVYGIHNPEIIALHRRICALPNGRARLVAHLEQKPGPMTVKRARQIARQAILDGGPPLADDETVPSPIVEWKQVPLMRKPA